MLWPLIVMILSPCFTWFHLSCSFLLSHCLIFFICLLSPQFTVENTSCVKTQYTFPSKLIWANMSNAQRSMYPCILRSTNSTKHDVTVSFILPTRNTGVKENSASICMHYNSHAHGLMRLWEIFQDGWADVFILFQSINGERRWNVIN